MSKRVEISRFISSSEFDSLLKFCKFSKNAILIPVYIQPGSKKNEICGFHHDSLKVKIAAIAIDGKANDECIRFFSKDVFNVSKNLIEIVSGETNRRKVISVHDFSLENLEKALCKIDK